MMAVATSPVSVCNLALQKKTTQIKKFKQRWIKLCDFCVTQHFKQENCKDVYSDHKNHWAPYTIKITWPISSNNRHSIDKSRFAPLKQVSRSQCPFWLKRHPIICRLFWVQFHRTISKISVQNCIDGAAQILYHSVEAGFIFEVDKNIAHLDSNLYSRSKTNRFICSSPSCSPHTPCHYSPHTTSLRSRVVDNDHNLLSDL
jgi:hypothetical protein